MFSANLKILELFEMQNCADAPEVLQRMEDFLPIYFPPIWSQDIKLS